MGFGLVVLAVCAAILVPQIVSGGDDYDPAPTRQPPLSKAESTRVLIDLAWDAYTPVEQQALCVELDTLGDEAVIAQMEEGARTSTDPGTVAVAGKLDFELAVDLLNQKCDTL